MNWNNRYLTGNDTWDTGKFPPVSAKLTKLIFSLKIETTKEF
jgi:hypothetical protein